MLKKLLNLVQKLEFSKDRMMYRCYIEFNDGTFTRSNNDYDILLDQIAVTALIRLNLYGFLRWLAVRHKITVTINEKDVLVKNADEVRYPDLNEALMAYSNLVKEYWELE